MGLPLDQVLENSSLLGELMCPVCLKLVDREDAVQTSACSHVFCGKCTSAFRANACPVCKQNLYQGASPFVKLQIANPPGNNLIAAPEPIWELRDNSHPLILDTLVTPSSCNLCDLSNAVYRMLGRIKVKCNHHARPCTWTGEWSELQAHLRESCPFEAVLCPVCQVGYERQVEPDHVVKCEQARAMLYGETETHHRRARMYEKGEGAE